MMLNAVQKLEAVILELPQLELEIHHHFAPGIYARELRIPKGVVLTGYIHKTEHLNIISAGVIEVSNLGESKHIEAPCTFVSKPGTKRAGYALQDTVWTTVHATDVTDVPELEDMLVTNDYSLVEHIVDQDDYKTFALEYGVTDELMHQLESIEVHKFKVDGVILAKSRRHGMGVFAMKDFDEGNYIAPMVMEGCEIEWGRYTNHSLQPNAMAQVKDKDNVALVAIEAISVGEEITVGYRAVMEALK